MSTLLGVRVARYLSAAVVFGAIGCGGQAPKSEMSREAKIPAGGEKGGAVQNEAPPVGQPAGGAAAQVQAIERKIIYTATLDVVVQDLDAATTEVEKQLAARKGRLVRSEARSDTGSRRTGTFTLEVPVDNFRALVDDLTKLGHVERNSTDSQDVTEEYQDVQIRVTNLKARHADLLRLRKERAASVEDMLKVDAQIAQVQTDLDRVEGRLNYLAHKAALSTVTLTLREIKDYVPPSAPTFRTQIGRTFASSVEALVEFGKGVVLTAVALGPWLPIFVPLGFVGYVAIRRRRRHRAGQPPPAGRG